MLPTNYSEGFDDGNKHAQTGQNDYEYDANGNMTKDRNKDIVQISYNHLNLPTEVKFGNNDKIEYIYTATGEKVQKKTVEGSQINFSWKEMPKSSSSEIQIYLAVYTLKVPVRNLSIRNHRKRQGLTDSVPWQNTAMISWDATLSLDENHKDSSYQIILDQLAQYPETTKFYVLIPERKSGINEDLIEELIQKIKLDLSEILLDTASFYRKKF